STSSRMKSSIQSSFFWNSGSVSKSQAIYGLPWRRRARPIFPKSGMAQSGAKPKIRDATGS
ncbi:MAG: hypothetical protein KBF34_04920, partial [Phenylobacterium sp.]|nr:hypothetical protein [Phenylobacterium sp.]